MGRELKRVPIDFDWPMDKVWYGYVLSACRDNECDDCRRFAKLKGIPLESYNCPDYIGFMGPPKGEGYQLWETTSEGSPVSPVFATLDTLCEWCEGNATVFADHKATRDQWKKMLEADFVYHQEGNVIFV